MNDPVLADGVLHRLAAAVEARTGLRLDGHRHDDLLRAVAHFESKGNRADEIAAALEGGDHAELFDEVVRHLTIGETSFFRDAEQFRAIEEVILRPLVSRRAGRERSLRIWSAGCSTGEEPYSLSILLGDIIPDIEGWDIRLLGTDINQESLDRARTATYGSWSFRDVAAEVRERHFVKEGSHWRLRPGAARLVEFSRLNLVEDAFPSSPPGFDLIVCRNVMIYFGASSASRVISRFNDALAPGGWLVLGHADTGVAGTESMEPFLRGNAILHRKPRTAKTDPEPRTRVEARGRAAQPVPRRPVPSIEVARMLADSGRPDEALLVLDELESGDGAWAPHYLAAVIELNRGALDAAAERLRRCIYLSSANPAAHHLAGVVNRRRGRVEVAARHWRIAAAILRGMSPATFVPGEENLTAERLSQVVDLELRRSERHEEG